MRVCTNCFRHLICRQRDVRKYVRLPRTEQQPTLLAELVTMHEAIGRMRGERLSYEECLATVRAEHPTSIWQLRAQARQSFELK
jgi:hypothetical protein